MRRFACDRCGSELEFDACRCGSCGVDVAYDVRRRDLVSLFSPVILDGAAPAWVRCRNADVIGCNWLAVHDNALCPSCARTRTVPDLSVTGALDGWATFEAAKRRVLHQLVTLPLELDAPDGVGPTLSFDLLTSQGSGGEPVVIGHEQGLVTLDVAEADLLRRERLRVELDEPYRTPLGHVRHEVGHFAWDVRIARCPDLLAEFRVVFGDERRDYAADLATYYGQQDDGSWQGRFITRYASAHPWEDAAETFAHLLHVEDVLETAAAYGLASPQALRHETFDGWYREWHALHVGLGALSRAVGASDPYPVSATPVPTDERVLRQKLAWFWALFICQEARAGAMPQTDDRLGESTVAPVGRGAS